jgi:hypothetical protein
MDTKTRKKLEAAGWKTGDARDFLELSDAEAEFIEMKLALAQDLRARRLERHLNQTQVARIVGSSQSRVAKMEAADPSVSISSRREARFANGGTKSVSDSKVPAV